MALTYDQISAITEKKFIPKLVDNIFDSIPLFLRLKKKQKLQSGGTQVLVPLNYALNGSGGWYAGSETLDTTDTENITAAAFSWAQLYENISIKRSDELKNMGDAAKVNFVKSKIEIAEKSMADRLGDGVYSDGSNSKSIVGTQVFIATSNTYGGISQSSYSWWQGNVDSTTTTMTISALQTMWGNCTVGSEHPSIVVSTQTNYDRFYALLQPQQRFMDAQMAKAGFTSLMFNGAPWVVDSKCPSGDVIMLNEKYLDLYPHKDENFRFKPFAEPVNQNLKLAKIYTMLVFASSNNRMHGTLNALTA